MTFNTYNNEQQRYQYREKEFRGFCQCHRVRNRAGASPGLISAANAQMLFHYWKMGNYILYHQNRQGWGGKVIKKLAHAIRFNYPEKKGYSVRNLAYMCQFARSYPLGALRSFIETDAKLLTPSVQKITDELQSLNNMTFTQEPLAQI